MSGDPNWSNVVLLLKGDGPDSSTNIVDSSPSHKTVTGNGNARITTAQSRFGGSSINFDGQDNPSTYLSIPDSTDWHFDGAYTIEFFLRLAVLEDSNVWLFSQSNSLGEQCPVRLDVTATTGKLNVLGASDNVNWLFTSLPSTNGLAAGVWYHIAMTDDNTTFRLFIDGNLEASRATWSKTDKAQPLMIGGGWSGGDRELNGQIDSLRITKGIARYTANFTPPTAPFPDGMGQVSGTVKDATGALAARTLRALKRATGEQVAAVFSGIGDANYNSNALLLRADSGSPVDAGPGCRPVTVNGGVTVDTSIRSLYGASMKFDGSTGYLTVPSSSDFSGAGGALTAEARIRPSSLRLQLVFGKQSSGVAREWAVYVQATGELQLLGWSASGATVVNIISTTLIAANTWTDLAVARSAAGVWYLFVNGLLQGSSTESAALGTNADAFAIGRHIGFPGTRDFGGHMEAVRVTRGVARYTATYTPPAERFPERASGNVGEYSFYTPTLDELNVICLDDDAGTVENDQILRVIPA
jgi:hypothetical protein